jgi:hypothetical protein
VTHASASATLRAEAKVPSLCDRHPLEGMVGGKMLDEAGYSVGDAGRFVGVTGTYLGLKHNNAHRTPPEKCSCGRISIKNPYQRIPRILRGATLWL